MALVMSGLLQAGSTSRSNLALRLGLPPDRVLDDLKQLEMLGIAERVGSGRDTAWRLADRSQGPRRHGGILDQIALELGLDHLSFLRGTSLTEPLARFVGDADARRPAHTSGTLRQKLHVIREPARDLSDHVDTIEDIIDALLRERRLSFIYRAGTERERAHHDVKPLTLVVYRRGVYLICGAERSTFTVATDQMSAVTPRERFSYPSDWRPTEHFKECFGIFATGPVQEVTLAFAARVEPYVLGRRWHPSARFERLPDGRLGLRLRVRGPELQRWILEWGETVEVIAPKSLRQQIENTLRAALAAYASERELPDA